MSYLLDTCTISDFGKKERNTLKRLKSTLPNEVFVSSLSVMELKYGLAINPGRAVKVRPIVEGLLASANILPFGVEEAVRAAEIRSILKAAGPPIGAYDVLIAATALEHQLVAVTSNTREFQRVPGLQIENWRLASFGN